SIILCQQGHVQSGAFATDGIVKKNKHFARFPSSGVTERSLARAGWFYTGVGDRVQCFRCNVTAEGWQPGDCPTEKHKQLSPSCSFIQSPAAPNTSGSQGEEPVGYLNMGFSALPPSSPLTSRGVEDMSHQRPTCHNPSMRREQDRLDSFHTWTVTVITPAELAKAGFYYLGQGDRVACFSCGGQLSNWEPGDRAVSEHQRHYPNCRYVRGDRADNVSLASATSEERLLTFVNWPSRIPVRPDQLANAGFYYVGRNDDVKCFCCDGGLRCWESGDDPWVEHAKWFPRCEYLLQEKGQDFVHQIQARFPRLLTEYGLSHESFLLLNLPMEEQLRRLQEERTCKVCMDKEVNIVFIPCGHLVVCKECAPSLRKCPICRGLVKGTVRTFLS
uniref:RING-type domain-containing protein n=1 Tax=Periophthalmus magnuspinnatus TaxID=409849 RepID=A0A3B3ZPQ1_9GOBI